MKLFKRNNKKENTAKTNNDTKKYEVIYVNNTTGEEIAEVMTGGELAALSYESWCDIFSYVELKGEV